MHGFLAALIAAVLAVNAAAGFIPDSDVCVNRDGRQLIIKTYTLSPVDSPDALVEEPFVREGFAYEFVSIVKEEKTFESSKPHSETLTIETETDGLGEILGALASTIPYSGEGGYSGTLALDHTALRTEATGYSTRGYTVLDTKTYSGLDRNDPSFIPRTTVKYGVTLTLQSIEWSVQGTAVSGDDLVATQYSATARYSGSSSYTAADGYVTTAVYTGEVVSSGIAAIVYTVTYIGTPIVAPDPDPEPQPKPEAGQEHEFAVEPGLEETPKALCLISTGAALLLIAGATIAYFLLRYNTKIYALESGGEEYGLAGKQRIGPRNMTIDLTSCARYPEGTAVVEIGGMAAKRLFGKAVRVKLRDGFENHCIEHSGNGSYWFKVQTTDEYEEEDGTK